MTDMWKQAEVLIGIRLPMRMCAFTSFPIMLLRRYGASL